MSAGSRSPFAVGTLRSRTSSVAAIENTPSLNASVLAGLMESLRRAAQAGSAAPAFRLRPRSSICFSRQRSRIGNDERVLHLIRDHAVLDRAAAQPSLELITGLLQHAARRDVPGEREGVD